MQSLGTFRLAYYPDDCNEYELETLITTVVERNVQNLRLRLPEKVMLPRCLFTCKALVKLRLYGVRIPWFNSICLSSLKKLDLYRVQYEVDEALPQLLSGCPVVEEFSSGQILNEDHMVYCHISSPTIQRLTVYLFYDLVGDKYSPDCRVEINAPALTYLFVEDQSSEHIEVGELTSLIEAHIRLGNGDDTRDDSLYSRSVMKFFGGLCNVKSLRLDLPFGREILDSAFSASAIRFHNLTKLELISECFFLSKFLQIADNLEILSFEEVEMGYKGWMEPQQVPTCLLSQLTYIKIDYIEHAEYSQDVAKYLLRNAQVLVRMEIHNGNMLDNDFEGKFEAAWRKISQYERGSEACEVAIIEWPFNNSLRVFY